MILSFLQSMILNIFTGLYLQKVSISFLDKKVVNLYISCTLDTWLKDLNTYFTLDNCLFGTVKLAKNTNPDKYKYSSFVIGFDSCSKFLWSDRNYGKNVIIFETDNSSSAHIDVKYPFNFTDSGKRFLLSLRYNRGNSFLFVYTVKMYQFKARVSEITPYPLCLGNVSKDFTLDSINKKNKIKWN